MRSCDVVHRWFIEECFAWWISCKMIQNLSILLWFVTVFYGFVPFVEFVWIVESVAEILKYQIRLIWWHIAQQLLFCFIFPSLGSEWVEIHVHRPVPSKRIARCRKPLHLRYRPESFNKIRSALNLIPDTKRTIIKMCNIRLQHLALCLIIILFIEINPLRLLIICNINQIPFNIKIYLKWFTGCTIIKLVYRQFPLHFVTKASWNFCPSLLIVLSEGQLRFQLLLCLWFKIFWKE